MNQNAVSDALMLDEISWEEACRRGKEIMAGILATTARYECRTNEIVITMNKDYTMHIRVELLQGLAEATLEELSDIRIEGGGTGIHFPQLGVDFYIPALMDGVYGTPEWMQSLQTSAPKEP